MYSMLLVYFNKNKKFNCFCYSYIKYSAKLVKKESCLLFIFIFTFIFGRHLSATVGLLRNYWEPFFTIRWLSPKLLGDTFHYP